MAKKKGGGGKLVRSETVTVRFDPMLRYAMELGARKQRRTVSSFIEWAVEKALADIEVGGGTFHMGEASGISRKTIPCWMPELWDVDPAERLFKLAKYMPQMLVFDEQRVVKTVRQNIDFFRKVNDHEIDMAKVNHHWEELISNTWINPNKED